MQTAHPAHASTHRPRSDSLSVVVCPSAAVGVSDVLVESAQTLSNICDHVVDTFDAAVKRYEQQQGAGKMQD